MESRLRYPDFVRLGLFRTRPSLSNAIKKYGFPEGKRTGPNSRTWGEGEVQCWIDSRPTEPKPTPVVKRPRGRPRRSETQTNA
jgi:predicted DNA-binding transcriptional regulator AlpA